MKTLSYKINLLFLILVVICFNKTNGEKYIGKNGPVTQSMSGSRVDIGAENIVHWSGLNVGWYLNSTGAGDGLTFNEMKSAVQNGFNSWQNISTADVSFTYTNSTSNTWSYDGYNVIYWAESGDPIFNYISSGTLAITVISINVYEEITDADIVFNGRDYTWRVNGNDYDIEAVAAHEIGHLIGLHHTELESSPLPTMYLYYQGTGARSLEWDDQVGVSFLYRGNLIDNETLSGTKYFNWDCNVSSGKTLTISSGSIVNFRNGALLTVNGVLNAVGTTSNRITLTRNGASNWGGLRFNSGSSGSVTYCNINYATTGIYCDNTSSPVISYNTISDGGSGSYGLYCNYASPSISYNRITGTTYAMVCLNYSSPQLLHNTLTSSTYFGLRAEAGSDVFLGSTSSNGNNSVFNNGSYEVYASYGSNIMARYNYWGWPVNENEFYVFDEVNSSIDHSYSLSSDPNSGIPKISSMDNNIAASQDTFFDTELLSALQNFFDGKNDIAIQSFKRIFENNKNNSKGKYALTMLKESLWRANKKEEFISYVNGEVLTNLSGTEELFATALELKNQLLLEKGKYEEVISNLNVLKSNFTKNKNTLKYALFNLGYVYCTNVNDKQNGKKYFDELEEKYPNDPLVLDSKILLGELERLPEVSQVFAHEKVSDEVIHHSKLHNNYPNPFNPTTKITFTLPTKDVVKLKVYDILGREIAVLAEGVFEVGRHEIEFNASRLPSGVYFYNLTTSTSSVTKKMLLLK